ncbi:clathrin adaptor, mu subunit [Serendipita vermifera]|nr:clathrin adaptor, mu subunit [Serendipita vermifera]
MGIDGVIILDQTGRPIIQTAFKTNASWVLQHVDALNNAYESSGASGSNYSAIDPIIVVNTPDGPSACCHVQHNSLRIICPVHTETDPLFVFAFMQTLLDVLQEYLGDVTAGSIRSNFDIVYQLLEEMLDNGFPLTTEPNALRDIIMPPSFFKKILAVAGTAGLAKAAATPFSSPIPWRTTGLRYNTNEIFFDFVEEMSGIMSKDDRPLNLDVWGKIKTNTRLTGTPDILLTLANPQILLDCSFHPCVRLPKWTRDKAISFVPPDGRFILMEYRLGSTGNTMAPSFMPPFILKTSVELLEGSANVDITLQARSGIGKTIDNVLLEWYLGKGVTTSSWIPSGGGGTYTFDTRTGVLQWQIPALTRNISCTLRGTFTSSLPTPRPAPAIQVTFSQSDTSFSSLKVQDLRVTGEMYKPFRGVRSHALGKIDVRW